MKRKREFKQYLIEKYTSDYQVEQHLGNVNNFCSWAITNNIGDILRVGANTLYDYVNFLQAKPLANSTINNYLNSIRKYYDCMIEQGYIMRNPSAGMHIGRKLEKVVEQPLCEKSLNTLYDGFETYLDTRPRSIRIKQDVHDMTTLRYKLVVSLLIYQGLDTGEINKLYVKDVDLKKQTLYVHGKSRRNSRILKLEACQILPFIQHFQSIPENQEKLFKERVHDISCRSIPMLKGIEPRLKNAEHIRQSRIMIWVSSMSLIDAQYLIGHRYASSTEGYQQQDTKELVDEINTLHLFR
jgi:integrase/recombinase XerD